MTPSRKKPGVAFWATVALVAVLVGYPLSWGPACRLVCDERCPAWVNTIYADFYAPIFFINSKSEAACSLSAWYLGLWGA